MAASGTQGRAGRASAGVVQALVLAALLAPRPLLAQSYPNPLTNTATVTAPDDIADPVPGNNTALDTNALAVQAQLSVRKTLLSASPVPAGGLVQYRIEVTNAGPSVATGVEVVDRVSPLLGAVTWTCTGATAASRCAQASGSGNAIDVVVTLGVGDSVVLQVEARAPGSTPATVPANTVELVLPAGMTDPVPADNSATAPAIPVQPNALVAVNDSFSAAVSSSTGGLTPTVLANDTINGNAVDGAALIIALVNAPAGYSINSAGVISVPAGAAAGARTLEYRICESTSPTNCATATASLVVAPTAVNDSFNVTGGSASFSGDLAANDNVPAGAVYSVGGGAPAGLAVTPGGTFTYAPAGGIVVPVTFSYQACLPAPEASVCSTATATLVVNANVLVASDDLVTTPLPPGAGATLASVLGNDTFNGGPVPQAQVALRLIGAPAGVVIAGDGSITLPAGTPAGPLALTYEVCEIALPGNCATAVVRLVVSPDAVDDAFTTPGGGRALTGSVAGNDNAASGSRFSLQVPADRGTVEVSADGTFRYLPTGSLTGPDSFTYTLCLPAPNAGVCDSATVRVTVAANELVAADDLIMAPLPAGGTTPASLLDNDTLNGVPVTATAVSLVLTGAPAGFAVTADGRVQLPASAVAGAVGFGYQICELPGGSPCATASVRLVVAPDAVDDSVAATAGVPLTGLLGDNDNVAAGAQFSLLAPATHGTVSVDATGGFTYTAQAAYAGPDTFRYQVCLPAPDSGVCDTATVTVAVSAAVLVAVADDFTATPVPATGALTASVLDNDRFNGQPILPAQATLALVNAPPAGYTLDAAGRLQVPAGAPAGPLALTYQLCQSGTGNCTTAPITLVVAPQARDDSFTTQVARALEGTVAANDSVAAGTTFALSGTAPVGLVFAADGSFRYVPPAQFTGTETFRYQACLAAPHATACDTATVTLVVNAGTLVARDDDFRAAVLDPATGGTTISVLANDTINGAVPPAPADVIVTLLGAPAGYVLNSTGTVSVPAGSAAGTVAFGYRLCEAVLPGNCAEGTVQLLLAPVAVADSFSTTAATPLGASVAANDNAPAGSLYSVTGAAPAGLDFNADGSFTYTPPAGSQGAQTFAYRVCLPAPDTTVCASATVTLNVNAGTLAAADDDFSSSPLDPGTGGSTPTVLDNDSLNGVRPPAPATVVLRLTGAPAGYVLQPDGVLVVSAGVPAGATTLTYQLCEAALDSNCDSARIRVVVAPAAADDVFSTPAGQLMSGTLAANDNAPVGAVYSLSGAAPAGLQLGPEGTFQYLPPAGFTGPVRFDYQTCLPAPDSASCSSATATINVNAGTLIARDDDFSAAPLAPGALSTGSVLSNDSLSGSTPPDSAAVLLALVGQPAGYAVDAGGRIAVPADARAGGVVLTYQLCEAAAPDNCAAAAVRLLVVPSATDDAYTTAAGQAVSGAVGDNDNVPPGAVFSLTAAAPPGLDFAATGAFRYAPPVGVTGPVSVDYRVCLPAPDSALCATATLTLTTTVGSLVAIPDDFSSAPLNPLVGGETASVLLNDTLDTATPPAPGDVLLTLQAAPAGYAIQADGRIRVAAGVAAGARVLDYQLCEAAAPGNCRTSTARVVVAPVGTDDAFSTPAGQPVSGTVAGNDNAPGTALFSLVGGIPAPTGLVFDASGSFSYTPVTGFSGVQTFGYQVCLPAPDAGVCAVATATLNVTRGTLVANDDAFPSPLAAGERTASVLDNDRLDTRVPQPAQVQVSLVGAPAGFSVDPDGTLGVAPGTLAGAVTLTYELCEVAVPDNCDTATVQLVVAPSPVDDAFTVQAGQSLSDAVGSNDSLPLDALYSLQGTAPAGLVFNADGRFTYTPPAGTASPVTFAYQACLPGANASVCATANVRLNINNGALVANDDGFGPLGPGTTAGSVLDNDVLNGITPPAAAVTLSLVGTTPGISLDSAGRVTIGVGASAGATALVYQICEVAAANNCATATLSVVVRPAPVDDAFTVQAGQTLAATVAGNDGLPPGSTFSVAAAPQGLQFSNSGSFTYTAPPGTPGPVTFDYRACLPAPDAGVCGTATATLTFAITAVVANDDSFPVPLPAGAVTPSVLDNDVLDTVTPVPAGRVQLVLVGAPAGFVIDSDGTVQIPLTATAGATALVYQLCEAASPDNCATARITLRVTPTPQPDAFAVQAGGTLAAVSVADNDRMPPGSRFTVQGTPPAGLVLAADGSLSYVPPAGTLGAVGFTYLACLPAPDAAVCGTTSATINVNTGTLQAGDDRFSGIAPGGTTPSVLLNDALNGVSPPPAGSVQVNLVGAPAGFVIRPDGRLEVPVAVVSGPTTLTYQLCETAAPGNCDTATVALVISPAPQDDAYAVQVGGTLGNGNVAANDNLPAGAGYAVLGAVPDGLTFNADGSFQYTPPPATVGPVRFDYQACLPAPDNALCGTASVTLNLNDGALLATDDSFIDLPAGSTSSVSVLDNDRLNGGVADTAAVSVALVGNPAGFSLDGAGRLGVSAGTVAGATTLTYALCERAAVNNCDTARITVVVRPAPVDDAFSVRAGQVLNASVASNDAMPAGTLHAVQGAAPDGLQFAVDGSFVYAPSPGTPGPVSFRYTACLPAPYNALCGSASVTVALTAGSVSAGDDALAGLAPGATSGISVLANDRLNGVSPPAPGDVVLRLVDIATGLTLNADGTLTAAVALMAGPRTLTYQLCEAVAPANCATATVTVVIAPSPQDDAAAVQAGQRLTGSVADNDNLPAGSTWSLLDPPPAGMTFTADGSFSYAPPAGTVGPVRVPYRACLPAPEGNLCGTATLVLGINNGALAAADDTLAGVLPGALSSASVLDNDSLNGIRPPDPATVVLTLVGAPSGYALTPEGRLQVPAGAPAGPVGMAYQLCEAAAPANCTTAALTVVVAPQPQPDAFAVQVGQTLSASVASNDAVPPGALFTVQGSAPAGLLLAGDGTLSYAPPAGTLGGVAFEYRVCLPAPYAAVCGTATATINVNTGTLRANDDVINGVSPGTTAGASVLANDSLDGVSPPAAETVRVALVGAPAGFLIDATGRISVGNGVDAGATTLTYRVCEAAAPANCDTARVRMVVTPVPRDDAFAVAPGQTLVDSVADNDRLPPGSVYSLQGPAPAGLVFAADGSFSYAPPAGTPGPLSLVYQACLPAPDSALCGTASLLINLTTGTLVAGDDVLGVVDAGASTAASVLANDQLNGVSPPAAVTVRLTLVGAPAGYSIAADGRISVAAGTIAGAVTLTYQICEAAALGNCDTARVTLRVTPAPQADVFAVQVGEVLEGTVAANDAMPPGTQWRVQGTPPAGLLFNADGSFRYAPPAGTTGAVTVTYLACLPAPDAAECGSAVLTLNVNTGTLVAADDRFVGQAPGSTTPSVLDNDLLNGVPLSPEAVTVSLVGTPEGITLAADGTLRIAAAVVSGTRTVSYQVCERAVPANCASASVTLRVDPAPQPDTFPLPARGTLSSTVAGNDNMPAGAVWRVQGPVPPGLTFNDDGSFVYVAPAGVGGTVAFTYQTCLPAPDAAVCASAGVQLVVGASGNVVLAVNDDFSAAPVDPATGGTLAGSVLDNDRFNTVSPPPVGSVVVSLTGSTPGFTLNSAGQISVAAGVPAGVVQLAYQLCENGVPDNCSTAVATVRVQATAGALRAVDDALGEVDTAGRPRVRNVLDNDTLDGVAVDPAQLLFTAVDTGALRFAADGWVDVLPGLSPGSYRTTYTVCLRERPDVCAVGTVSVAVVARVAQLEVNDDQVSLPQNGALEIDVLANDRLGGAAVDPARITLAITTPPPYGTATVMPQARIRFAAATHFAGVQAFAYEVCAVDNATGCAVANVSVTVDDNVLTLVDDAVRAQGTGALVIDVLANDGARSAPLDPASLRMVQAPEAGTAQCGEGRCQYTPAAAFAGTDSFRYRVCDLTIPTAQCAEANVAVTVDGQQAVLRLTKTAATRRAQIGDLVRYTVTVDNVGEVDATGATLLDTLPPGFTFVSAGFAVEDADNTARTAGVQPLRIEGIDVPAGGRATVAYVLRVGAGTGSGVHTNRITAVDGQNRSIGNVAAAEVEVGADPLLDESLIVGSVFDDRNGNGLQDTGERGIPGVRVAAVEGLVMETDAYGRYHLVGIEAGQARGRNFILKVDPATLPDGARFTTANPLVRRITPGLPVRFDFGVRLPGGSVAATGGAPARIELGSALFIDARAQWPADRTVVLEAAAQALVQRGGGRVLLPVAGVPPALAWQRARAVQQALAARVSPAVAAASWIELQGGDTASPPRLRLDEPAAPPGAADHAPEGR